MTSRANEKQGRSWAPTSWAVGKKSYGKFSGAHLPQSPGSKGIIEGLWTIMPYFLLGVTSCCELLGGWVPEKFPWKRRGHSQAGLLFRVFKKKQAPVKHDGSPIFFSAPLLVGCAIRKDTISFNAALSALQTEWLRAVRFLAEWLNHHDGRCLVFGSGEIPGFV